jgi:biotin carboxyl carrier protein
MHKDIVTPVPGELMAVHKRVGDNVRPGDLLFTMSLMKTEVLIESDDKGRVIEVVAQEGALLEPNTVVLVIEV